MPDVESIHECQFNESVVFCGNFTDAIGMYELGLGNILKKRGLTRMVWRKIEGEKKMGVVTLKKLGTCSLKISKNGDCKLGHKMKKNATSMVFSEISRPGQEI